MRILKKLPPDAGFGDSPSSALNPGRDLVPGRGQDWPEERPRLPVGTKRHAASSGQGSSLQERLHLRRHLPGQGNWRWAGDAIRRHSCHAAPPHGNQLRHSSWCPCRLAHGPGRMAHHGGTENPQKHHPNLPATPLARTQSGRKHMAIYTRQLAIQQGLRHLRRHRRGQLRGLEPPYRQALENHVHRTEKMGARRLIIRAVGIRRCVFRPVEGFENFAEHRGQAIHTVTSGRTECPGRKGR